MGVRQVAAQAKKKLFLNDLARNGNISNAAKRAGVVRRTHYDWLDNDPDYKQQYDDALADFKDGIEFEIHRRAMKAKVRSDTMLIFEAKKWIPEYRDNYKVEHTGPSGGPMRMEIVLVDPDGTQ